MKKFFSILCLMLAALCATAEKLPSATGRKTDFTHNVKHGARGKVYVDHIPPLSQKQSYCVPATISMILKYYDTNVSQRELAKLFSSSKKTGTSIAAMEKAFRSSELSRSFFLKKVRTFMGRREFDALVQTYRANAPKRDLKRLDQARAGSGDLFSVMNVNVLRRCQFSPTPENAKLFSLILKAHVDAGHPLFWSVWMGLDPETPSNGWHARVLCGYQTDDDGNLLNVLYLDTWSRRTEMKKMAADRAVMMTESVYSLLPMGADDPANSPFFKERP